VLRRPLESTHGTQGLRRGRAIRPWWSSYATVNWVIIPESSCSRIWQCAIYGAARLAECGKRTKISLAPPAEIGATSFQPATARQTRRGSRDQSRRGRLLPRAGTCAWRRVSQVGRQSRSEQLGKSPPSHGSHSRRRCTPPRPMHPKQARDPGAIDRTGPHCRAAGHCRTRSQ
jgi:hypothetical protein